VGECECVSSGAKHINMRAAAGARKKGAPANDKKCVALADTLDHLLAHKRI